MEYPIIEIFTSDSLGRVNPSPLGAISCGCCGASYQRNGCVWGFGCNCTFMPPPGSTIGLPSLCSQCLLCTVHCICGTSVEPASLEDSLEFKGLPEIDPDKDG